MAKVAHTDDAAAGGRDRFPSENVTHRPAVLSDWDDSADPGMLSSHVDQLANRVTRGKSYVFITNLTGAGSISNKTYVADTVPGDKVLTAAESDDDDVTVHLEIHGLTNDWQAASIEVGGAGATPVTVNKQDWSQVGDSRIWTATANLTDADTTGTITATMSDGDTATFDYTRVLDPPAVLTAVIDVHSTNTGGDPHCPYAQTQVKEDDTLDISGTAETHADQVYVKDYEVTNGQGLQGPFACDKGTPNAWSGTINVGSGTDATANYKVYAKVTGGSAGADFTSTENVDLNQTVPTFSGGAQGDISYPGTQEALKDAETCDVTVTHTNIEAGDTYLYDDNSTGELTIPNTTTYAATKTGVARASGNYRETGTNYRLTVTRTTKNGASATKSVTVKIAHVFPTITVTEPGSRMRSKTGADKTHTITLSSDQALKSTPSLSRHSGGGDDGPALGAFGGGPTTWTATLTCQENDAKNTGASTYTWQSLSATNRAEKVQTTISGDATYVIGGFEERDVAISKFDQYEPIGTMATNKDNPGKLVCEYVGLGSATYVANTDDDPGAKKFTIVDSGGNFDADGDYVKCNDSNIYDAVDYTMRIEESI